MGGRSSAASSANIPARRGGVQLEMAKVVGQRGFEQLALGGGRRKGDSCFEGQRIDQSACEQNKLPLPLARSVGGRKEGGRRRRGDASESSSL